jgi:hypothetical protein
MNNVDESNFVLYAAKYYDNPHCHSTTEFIEDISRFKYLKKLFKRYSVGGEIKERLILNHLIVLYNCFDQHTTKMLLIKMPEYKKYLLPFIEYLGRLPVDMEIEEKDQTIKDVLGKL